MTRRKIPRKGRCLVAGLFLLLTLALPAAARPQLLVVVADHLTLDDVTRPDLPNLARLRAEGQMALMSPGLPHGKDPVADVYASLGAGDSIRVGDVSQGRLAAALHRAEIRATLVGDADGDDTGEYRPASYLLPSADEAQAGSGDGTVRDPIACGGRRIDPERLWVRTRTALRVSEFVIVHDGDFARVERESQQGDLLANAYSLHRRQALAGLDAFLGLALSARGLRSDAPPWLMVVTPTPPPTPGQDTWDRLTPFLQLPPPPWSSAGNGPLARSDTTQTVGLVSARDLAPTILHALGVPAPVQMTGAVIGDAPLPTGEDALPRLRRLDRLTRLNQDIQNPLFWGLGLGAGVAVFAGLGLFLSGRMVTQAGTRRASLYGLRLLSAWPLALLLAPLAGPPKMVPEYFAWIIVLTALAALVPSPSVIYGLTAIVLLFDGLTGTRLVSQSVLSAYALSGIRFYGIGNEYMGLLIGGALMAGVRLDGRGGGFLLFVWFALVAFVLSYPEFGAKAGGAVTATATFVLAWRGLRRLPASWKHGAAGVIAGFALVFLWALVGHWLPSRHTHIDTAVHAVGQGRLGYIAGVALRKIGLAVHVLLLPGTAAGVLGLVAIGGFARLMLRREVGDYLRRHPRFTAVWRAGLAGCLVAVLFNDSGIVAAILLLTSLSAALLHGLYQECALSPSMSGKPESASPSVTP